MRDQSHFRGHAHTQDGAKAGEEEEEERRAFRCTGAARDSPDLMQSVELLLLVDGPAVDLQLVVVDHHVDQLAEQHAAGGRGLDG